jgi:hypothetical protein
MRITTLLDIASMICAVRLSQGRGIAVAPILSRCTAVALILIHIPKSDAFSTLIVRSSPAFRYTSHNARASGQTRIRVFALEEPGPNEQYWKVKFDRVQALRKKEEQECQKAEHELQKVKQELKKEKQERQKFNGMDWFCLADLTPKPTSFDEVNSLCPTNGPTRVLRELLWAKPVRSPPAEYFEPRVVNCCRTFFRILKRGFPIGCASFNQWLGIKR